MTRRRVDWPNFWIMAAIVVAVVGAIVYGLVRG